MSIFKIFLFYMHFHSSANLSEERGSISIFLQGKRREKNTCTFICRFGLVVGFVLFFRKSLKEVDQKVSKAEIKKQKRGKEMTPTPTFGK